MEPDEGQPEMQPAQGLVQETPGHLREPEIDPRIGREHDRPEQHVMEMRDHEIAVGDVEVDRRAASITPVNPPNRNVTRNPQANSIGVWKLICPFHMVPIQLKNFSPVGIAIKKLIS